MKIRRIIKWLLLGLLALVLLAIVLGGISYYLACKPPASYRPAQLSREQQTNAALDFINGKLFNDFGNRTGLPDAFDWTLDEKQANEALASMDEIGFQMGRPRGTVQDAMKSAQVDGAMVEFHDGFVRLMGRWGKYDKVLTADMAFEQDPQGRWVVRLKGAQVGSLPVPPKFAMAAIKELAGPPEQAAPPRHAREALPERMGVLLRAIFRSVANEQPLEPVIVWPANKARMKVAGVQVRQGTLQVRVEPLQAQTRGDRVERPL